MNIAQLLARSAQVFPQQPAVLLGDQIARRVSMKLVHGIAAAVFAVLGIATLLGAGSRFGI